MPPVSTFLSGGVSMGILAGVVSGLFYLVVAGLRWAGEVKLQSGEWFYRQIQSRFHRPTAALTDNNNTAHDNGVAMDSDSAQVREFIERLVEALVSGQLDDVKVNRLYHHPEYKPVPEEDTPSSVHAALKQRVQHIIQEAMTLPNLKSHVPTQNGSSVHKWEEDITSMTYEDILATAILNKVIERFQQRTGVTLRDTVDNNSNLLSDCAQAMDHAPKYISRVEIGVNGPSSLEDGDSSSQDGLRSWSGSSHNEPVSMTIEECIEEEEVTMYDSEGEEEDRSSDGMATTTGSELDFYLSGLNLLKQRRVPFPELGVDIVDAGEREDNFDDEGDHSGSHSPQPTDLVSPVDSWEENWLFQRRRLKAGGPSRHSPMPVPMLVPNPSEDFRARIGDRDAEEVSDLSDCSDGALEDIVLAGVDIELRVPEVCITSADAYIDTCQDLSHLTEEDAVAQESTTELLHTDVSEVNSLELTKAPSMECLSEFGQQDSEYTEDYEQVTQRQMSSLVEQSIAMEPPVLVPVPRPRTLAVSSQQNKTQSAEETETRKQEQEQQNGEVQAEEDSQLAAPPRPGTIAEREHRKWETAAPLPNNPYSPENISKRLNKLSSAYSSRTSNSASIEFPELKAEAKVAAPLQVVCGSSEPDYKRYGRDYYINQSKVASGERRSSSRVTSPLLEQKFVDLLNHETQEQPQTETNDTVTQLCGLVETEIAKWQKEINQTEQQWLQKLQHSSSVDTNSPTSSEPSVVSHKQNTNVVMATQNGGTLLTVATPSAEQQKTENQPEINVQTPKEENPQLGNRAEKDKMEVKRNKLRKESGEWRNASQGSVHVAVTPSEGSTVSSSDLDLDADVPVVLPSVKELAKHFSGGGTSDSDSSTAKAPPTLSRNTESRNKVMEPPKLMLIVEKDRHFQPVREVHSLTARSISRQFREGLRRNLPTQLDRNLHTATESIPREHQCTDRRAANGVGDSSCSSPELQANGVDGKADVPRALPRYNSIKEASERNLCNTDIEIVSKPHGSDTTPGYTSDESGTRSPSPPVVGRRKLQSNIAFWEQLQQNSK